MVFEKMKSFDTNLLGVYSNLNNNISNCSQVDANLYKHKMTFDYGDQNILIKKLNNNCCLQGKLLQWLLLFISART